MKPDIPADGFMGTCKRTWLERESGRVGRVFRADQLAQINQIHSLCKALRDQGVPVQVPLDTPLILGDKLVCFYSYSKDEPQDYQDEWYCPVESSQRRIQAAKVFARFQRAAAGLHGPMKPLDFPYCNSLHWMNRKNPMAMVLGTWAGQPETRELAQSIQGFWLQGKGVWNQLRFGLCHGDYHSGNIIFYGQQLGHVVDFGFWIHHPLQFDLAIAAEMWSRDWDSESFALNFKHFREFIDVYTESGGPVRLDQNLGWILPLGRIWIESTGLRRSDYPEGMDQARRGIRMALDRLNWYKENLEGLL